MHTALVQRLVRDHSLWEETVEEESLQAATPAHPTPALR
jgi:hypothetical protein